MRAQVEARLAALKADLLVALTVEGQITAQQARLAQKQAEVAATVQQHRGAILVLEAILSAVEEETPP